jgi:hypothetical protein
MCAFEEVTLLSVCTSLRSLCITMNLQPIQTNNILKANRFDYSAIRPPLNPSGPSRTSPNPLVVVVALKQPCRPAHRQAKRKAVELSNDASSPAPERFNRPQPRRQLVQNSKAESTDGEDTPHDRGTSTFSGELVVLDDGEARSKATGAHHWLKERSFDQLTVLLL